MVQPKKLTYAEKKAAGPKKAYSAVVAELQRVRIFVLKNRNIVLDNRNINQEEVEKVLGEMSTELKNVNRKVNQFARDYTGKDFSNANQSLSDMLVLIHHAFQGICNASKMF